MRGELFFCQDCENHNRNPVVALDRHLRCEQCGSDAVESLERMTGTTGHGNAPTSPRREARR
jgi:anaerobic ribonucleoside-triphosphate reductase